MKNKSLKKAIEATILEDKGKLLKPNFRKQWKESNYLRGYSYLVSEVLYHFEPLFKEYTPRMMYVDNETHWFLMNEENGNVVDMTSEQYTIPLNYDKSIKRAFFKGTIPTERGYISKRGMKFYKKLKKYL